MTKVKKDTESKVIPKAKVTNTFTESEVEVLKTFITKLEEAKRIKDGEASEFIELIMTEEGKYTPKYESELASGFDLKARISGMRVQYLDDEDTKIRPGEAIYGTAGVTMRDADTIIIPPHHRALIFTGVKSSFPNGYEMQVRPRSGLAVKSGISIVNTPGTIDSDYRDEWGVIVINHGLQDVYIKDSDRICQAVIAKASKLQVKIVRSFSDDVNRGGGFGHSGN